MSRPPETPLCKDDHSSGRYNPPVELRTRSGSFCQGCGCGGVGLGLVGQRKTVVPTCPFLIRPSVLLHTYLTVTTKHLFFHKGQLKKVVLVFEFLEIGLPSTGPVVSRPLLTLWGVTLSGNVWGVPVCGTQVDGTTKKSFFGSYLYDLGVPDLWPLSTGHSDRVVVGACSLRGSATFSYCE